MPLIVLGALLLAAGVLAAALLAGDDPKEAVTTAPKTVKETVTLPGQTVVKTVTTEAAPTTAPATTAPATRPADPSQLNDQGFELMQAGNYNDALPLLEQAVAGLSGSGGTARGIRELQPGCDTRWPSAAVTASSSCSIDLRPIQGKRKEITRARHEAKKNCEGER